jgi:hypothetical protein
MAETDMPLQPPSASWSEACSPPCLPAFLIISRLSSTVMSGVVFTALPAPPAEKMTARAAALTLSGICTINTESYSPKAMKAL